MRAVNLLEFLNSARQLSALNYAHCDRELIDLLDHMNEDEQFTRRIDLGIIYLCEENENKYTIVDGLRRIVSISLLLHAICECYKKTTERNEKAIKTIRSKYLLRGSKMKLELNEEDEVLYNKIVNGERLSGHEKSKPMFTLLHKLWLKIKDNQLSASKIFSMLQKIEVIIVDTNHVSPRNLYYTLNSSRGLAQLPLIDDYIKEKGVEAIWQDIKDDYFIKNSEIIEFLKDFFITKFSYNKFNPEKVYESFVNYFETMTQYISPNELMSKIKHSALLYYNIININFVNEDIKKAFINIKKHSGEDTYAYILSVYEDFTENNITESIFIEILNTIDEYLKNRQTSGKNIDFNELIQYLNAFITCK